MKADPIQQREKLKSIAEIYFSGMANKDMSDVPWAEDVILRSPLAPDGLGTPLVGASAVREWFKSLYPVLGDIKVIEHYFNEDFSAMATRSDVEITDPPCVLRVVDRFRVNPEGKIVEQENHYDPRLATGGSS